MVSRRAGVFIPRLAQLMTFFRVFHLQVAARMTHTARMTHDPYDHYTGYGGVHHPLEQDGRGGNWTWELTMLLVPINLLIIVVQFLAAVLTPLGALLAVTGQLSAQEYGPLFSRPLPIVVTGLAVWAGTRLLRTQLTHAFGGGAVPRSTLYSPEEDVR